MPARVRSTASPTPIKGLVVDTEPLLAATVDQHRVPAKAAGRHYHSHTTPAPDLRKLQYSWRKPAWENGGCRVERPHTSLRLEFPRESVVVAVGIMGTEGFQAAVGICMSCSGLPQGRLQDARRSH